MGEEGTIDQIAVRIVELADAALSTRSYYLLSELGKDLGSALNTLKLVTKQSLGNFIRDRLSDKFTIVKTGEFNNVQALVRAANSTVEPEPALTVSEQVIIERMVVAKPTPRFNYRFWAAFSVPIQTGRRFLNLTDFVFKDVEPGETPPEGWVEITPDFVADPGLQARDRHIAENIVRWCHLHGRDPADFHQKRAPRGFLPTVNTGNVLEAMIAALDHKQLSSTSLSLDVVAALMRKKV
ncbi:MULTISPECIES: hypothetical protein [unclassified Bradyrhizobium]|uniref:hypothetical protein n=1 Tax=unclassified Bradyrhizobium TaxID=2631580 RepID=UPI0028E7EF17|nr:MULTISPECIES: hypothetical protein [unclassified Bradyrhizobium]